MTGKNDDDDNGGCNDNYDGNDDNFDDNDEKNYQITYKYKGFWVKI